jgi:hypothetical protein
MTATDISLEMMRRQLSGQSNSELEAWVVDALRNGLRTEESEMDGWQIRTAADALEPKEPQKYLIDQMLPYPCLAIVYGGPGSLKSMILADMAVCVAGGLRWLDTMSCDSVQPGVSLQAIQAPVLWVDFDNGSRRTDIRIGAMLRAHGLGPETPIHYVSMPTPHLDASKDTHIEAMTALIRRNGYKLVIVDNLGLITGNTEENSADMANVMGRLRRLAESTEAAIILVHHQRKSAANSEANGLRLGESLRGHSSIEASLDLALLVDRKAGEDVITIRPTKVRDFLSFDIIGAHFTYEHTPDSRDLWQARFFSEATMSREEAAISQLRATIMDICTTQPGIGQKQLVDEVRDRFGALHDAKVPGVNKVRGTVEMLVKDGRLTRSGKAGAYQYWSA